MYKIVAAVNSMIANPNRIGTVIKSVNGSELFFTYEGKFKWSLNLTDDGEYHLHYYPGEQSIQDLASMSDNEWRYFNELVTYSTREIKTKEARESFAELYQVIQGKLYGIDEILDHIIKTAA
jgi:hypothetical protein